MHITYCKCSEGYYRIACLRLTMLVPWLRARKTLLPLKQILSVNVGQAVFKFE